MYSYEEKYRPSIRVDRTSLPTALRHGMELWWDDSTPKQRLDQRGGNSGFTRYVNARVEGKLAEVAFSKLLKRDFDIDSAVDWRIYGDYETTDDGDLQYIVGKNGEHHTMATDLDIKKTKPWNQWLAIREEIYQKLENDAPVVLTKFAIQEDIDLSPWEDSERWEDVDDDEEFRDRLLEFADDVFPLDVVFQGTAYPHEFTDFFEQGSKLYDPTDGCDIGPNLRRDNRGIHVSDLVDTPVRWNACVHDIVGDNPVSWSPLPIAESIDIPSDPKERP